MAVSGVALLTLAPLPAAAHADDLQQRVAALLRERAGPGTRFGLLVTTEDDREIVAIAPDERFVPASTTKLFTTAVAYATLPMDMPDAMGGTSVRLDGRDVVLTGHGDARLSSADDCASDCLATLADAVALRTRLVRDVIGEDSAFPDERWSPGMAWDDIPTRSGTGVAALSLDDNEWRLTVSPTTPGSPADVAGSGDDAIDNRVMTGFRTDIGATRAPGTRVLRLQGTIAAGTAPEVLRVGIDDPADHAAWRFAALLRARGVRVVGRIMARHRPLVAADDPARRGNAPAARPPTPAPIAHLTPPPLADDVRITNKVSQNLHAELLLRRVGAVAGSGSIADGQRAVSAMLTRAGVPRWAYDLYDGSGMSTYNRVTPRAVVSLLRWTAAQSWGAAWRGSLPVGGVDGTLRRRFAGTALAGKLFAKTGTLGVSTALAGFMVAKSGRTLTFAGYANDMPRGAPAAPAIDAVLQLIAAEN